MHPRGPTRRVQAELERQEGEQASGEEERSGVAKYAVRGAMLMGAVQSLVVDAGRLVKKYPEALRRGVLGTAIDQTLLTAPDSRIIDPSAPRVATAASAGKSFTKFDELAMKASVGMASAISFVQFGSSLPNLYDALDGDGGVANLASTTSGRAGVLQFVGGSIGLGMLAKALHETRGQGVTTFEKITAAGRAPIMASPLWKKIGVISGLTVTLNELGYLDWLNKDDSRSFGSTIQEAAKGTPVLNDSTMRGTALFGLGGLTAYKVSRTVSAAGSLAGMTGGQRFGSAVMGGLLGAQLLGLLGGLDKD